MPSSARCTSRVCRRIFGADPTIEFLTSGIGVVAFILYLPGGLAEVLRRLGEVVTTEAIRTLLQGRHGREGWGRDRLMRSSPPSPASTAPSLVTGKVEGQVAIAVGGTPRSQTGFPSGPARLDIPEGLGVSFGGVHAVVDVSLTATRDRSSD